MYLEFDYNYFPSFLNNITNLRKFYFNGKNCNKFSLVILPESIEHIDIKDIEHGEKTFTHQNL